MAETKTAARPAAKNDDAEGGTGTIVSSPKANALETTAEAEDFDASKEPDAAQQLTKLQDPEGEVSNRIEGTIQAEPTAEELPSDAKIAPVLEQVGPNQNALAVGALPQPDEIAGAKQPKEGKKVLDADMSKAADFLPEDSEQGDLAKEAETKAKTDQKRGIV